MSIARARIIIGSLYGLMRNALGLNVATPLESQELSCTVSPDRRLVVLGHDPIAGFARDHGTVADEAAMIALHTLDSTTLLAEPRFVAPGDSCIRTDDPGWRWHCLRGHGTQLSDWDRRPLAGAIADLASGVAGAQPLDADLTAIAAQGVSAWGLTRLADSGATAAKNALGIQRADIGDASTAGRALMAVSTPSEASVPVISIAGAVTTAPLSSLGGGGGGARGLFSGQLSPIPTRSSTGFAAWLNQGAASASDAEDGILITCSTQGTDDHRALVKPAPTAPYDIRALLLVEGGRANANCFVGYSDGIKLQTVYVNLNESINGARWSSVNTYASGAGFSYVGLSRYAPVWFRLLHDGSNIAMQVSHTGAAWRAIYSHPVAGGYLANYATLVIGVCPTSTDASVLLLSYRETAI